MATTIDKAALADLQKAMIGRAVIKVTLYHSNFIMKGY